MHYKVKTLECIKDWVIELTNLPTMWESICLAYLVTYCLNYRPVARSERLIVVGDHMPRQLGKGLILTGYSSFSYSAIC